ncbi:hypothetical protein [Candidatus Chloroploca asiatica]|uniref:Uncharacterized protein n=1 Tax=Candidatus Chloroploca asiatica TaxID=1506545 RepID=A0A2H3KMG5_9CHLR|nr:hypothetical protein [Candidatus Chloroploca asiatica]PDV99275.1 hypothetical protein A9Q02_13010 [Candidatus Chloroploca asiatica]
MREIEVIRETRRLLQAHGLLGQPILDLYTDAHPSLIGDPSLEPFQRFTLQFDAFATHPDLVGRLADGSTMFAVEAKGEADWLKGLAQAETYRYGFHAVLMAVAGTPSPDLLTFARQRGVGILALPTATRQLLEPPVLHLPLLKHAEHIRRQFSTGSALRTQFSYNLPTHYLACAACLYAWEREAGLAPVELAQLEAMVRQHYPVMPRLFKPALHGAEKLGLLVIQGRAISLSPLGRTCASLLPPAAQLATLHRAAIKRQPLVDLDPRTAAVLRILLLRDPIAGFLNEILTQIGPHQPVPMPVLVETAARFDKLLTPLVFFFPGDVATLLDDQGFLVWRKIQPQHYRTSIYMQYKQIMTHAGMLHYHGVGGTSSQHYQPERDLWEVRI